MNRISQQHSRHRLPTTSLATFLLALPLGIGCGDVSSNPDAATTVEDATDTDSVDAPTAADASSPADAAPCGEGFWLELDGMSPTRVEFQDNGNGDLQLDRSTFTVELWVNLDQDDVISVERRGPHATDQTLGNAGWRLRVIA